MSEAIGRAGAPGRVAKIDTARSGVGAVDNKRTTAVFFRISLRALMRFHNFVRHAIHPLSKPHAAYIINWSNVNDTITQAVIMDAIWFQQTLERAGASQADLARHLRLAPSAVSPTVKGEPPTQ